MIKRIQELGLSAPDAFFVTDEATLLMMAGGCGPGRLGDWLVPDTIWGLNIRPACFVHDYMYATGETADDKRWADDIFLSNMLTMIDSETTTFPFLGKTLKMMRRNRAMIYYSAVRDNGEYHFEKSTI